MVKKQAAKAGGRLVRNIAEEVGEQLTRQPKPDVLKPKTLGDVWGWKGGKPGEITSKNFFDEVMSLNDSKRNLGYTKREDKVRREISQKISKLHDDFYNQLEKGGLDVSPDGEIYAISRYGGAGYDMESVGVPREYTGKLLKKGISVDVPGKQKREVTLPHSVDVDVLKSVPIDKFDEWLILTKSSKAFDDPGRKALDALNLLNPYEREVFIRLAPNWESTFNELVAVVKAL